jgi:hypothetical protein
MALMINNYNTTTTVYSLYTNNTSRVLKDEVQSGAEEEDKFFISKDECRELL